MFTFNPPRKFIKISQHERILDNITETPCIAIIAEKKRMKG